MRTDLVHQLFKIGMQFAKNDAGQLKAFGFSGLGKERVNRVGEFISKNAKLIKSFLDVVDVFNVRVPGYCPTCPAYVSNSPREYKCKIHTEWCVHSAFFKGKSAKPVQLVRYEPEFAAFKRIHKRKYIGCPLTLEEPTEN